MTIQPGANLYSQGYASHPENVEIPAFNTRAPSVYDNRFPLGKRWINTAANTEYSLTSFSVVSGSTQAHWTLLNNNTVAAAVTGISADNAVEVLPAPDGSISLLGGTGVLTFGDAGAHTIFINISPGGFSWNNTTTNTAMNVGQGYLCTGGGALSLSLPTTGLFGTGVAVVLDGSTSFTITQSAGQQVRVGKVQTTSGAGGSIASTFQGDVIYLIIAADGANSWVATSTMGNLTIV